MKPKVFGHNGALVTRRALIFLLRSPRFCALLIVLVLLGCGDSVPVPSSPELPTSDVNDGDSANAGDSAEPTLDGGPLTSADQALPMDAGSEPTVDATQPIGDLDGDSPLEDASPVDAESGGEDCPRLGQECEGIRQHERNAPHRFPIVLVHGMGGFENIGPLEYYYGIPELLTENGYQVHVTITDPFNSSEVRAEQLAPQIDRILACTCRDKVNLIAHSQGGIDARLLISGMGYHDRVASLTTISTPHRGTPVADVTLGLTRGPGQALINMFLNVFSGVVYGPPDEDPNVRAAMLSCTTQAMTAFNEQYPNADGVAYYSYAGLSGLLADGRPECEGAELPRPRRGDVMAPEFSVSFAFLGGSLVANDGLVPVESAKWGRFRGCIPADHLDEIGQIGGLVDRFDYRRFYLELAEFIGDEGL